MFRIIKSFEINNNNYDNLNQNNKILKNKSMFF